MSAPDTGSPVVIDGGDRACVELLLQLNARIAGLRPETLVDLIAADPAAPLDLAAWCHLTGHAYLGPLAGQTGLPAYRIRVSASNRQVSPRSPWRLAQ